MQYVRSLACSVVRAVLVIALLSSVARGEFQVLSQSAEVDLQREQVRFRLAFNQPPDFFSVDEFGRPVNAFQYWYDSEPGGFAFAGEDVVVIRGPEIRFGELPIRDSLNPGGEEWTNAEGWGRERGIVPFALDGSELRFIAPWKALGETDGRFSYRLIALESGSQTMDTGAVIIDLPSPLTLGLALALMFAGTQHRWERGFSFRRGR